MFTLNNNVKSGIWPMTKENTYYGFKSKTGQYHWYKTKASAIKNTTMPAKEIFRATLINGTMYINLHYLKIQIF